MGSYFTLCIHTAASTVTVVFFFNVSITVEDKHAFLVGWQLISEGVVPVCVHPFHYDLQNAYKTDGNTWCSVSIHFTHRCQYI